MAADEGRMATILSRMAASRRCMAEVFCGMAAVCACLAETSECMASSDDCMADAAERQNAVSTVWQPARVYGEPIEVYSAVPKMYGITR